ncbi:GatB/YqeY domain-containing protein [Candidatus Roizmanbacteria bacterium]|nr:GatB/YqeY domain-containing protein [Candidatus Roizmanbacteria bacterium]
MIKQKLQDDQIRALKSGDKDKLSALRYILAQIKNKEIEKQANLSDDDVINVLKKITKELRESITAFEKGGRNDLVVEYKRQFDIITPYLPKEISDEELEKAINELIEKNKELYDRNQKVIIGICMKELRSKADSSRIIAILNKKMGSS